MLKIEQTGPKEYLTIIPISWNHSDDHWEDLISSFDGCFEPDGTIYINLSNMQTLSTYAFNRLFDLTSVASYHLCRLVFMNVEEELEEKIAMLNHQSE